MPKITASLRFCDDPNPCNMKIYITPTVLSFLLSASQPAHDQGPSNEEIKKATPPLANTSALNLLHDDIPTLYDHPNMARLFH